MQATELVIAGTQFVGPTYLGATKPTYSFAGDTNTGIFGPDFDNVGISCGGIERVRVLSNGNVGIGTGVPMAKLDVLGNINANSITSIAYVGTKNFTFNPTNSLGRYFIGKITGGSLIKLFIYDNGWGHGCGAEVTININWGSTNTNLPNVTMSAGTQQNYAFYFQGTVLSGVGYLWFNETQVSNNNNIEYNIKIFANGSVDLNTNDGLTGSSSVLLSSGLFHVNGNVGIGTTTPRDKLDINGNLLVNGFIKSNKGVIQVVDAQLKATAVLSTSSSTLQPVGLTVSITPSFISSKIKVEFFSGMCGGANYLNVDLQRSINGGTWTSFGIDPHYWLNITGGWQPLYGLYWDSPNTILPVTYRVAYRSQVNGEGATLVYLNSYYGWSVMEVGQ
jgi:hypothetical protein